MVNRKKYDFDDCVKVPKSFVISDGIRIYDFKAMRNHFNDILKLLGETTEN
tara:strand:- start:849 stop:1001 length:153 start_codon:yes stop_codon:yes gene_type:complete